MSKAMNNTNTTTQFDALMNSKDFHIVFDNETPLGGVKFVSTSGDEVIVYPDDVDKKIEKIKESAVAEEEKEETIVAEEKEDTAITKTTKKHNRGIARFIAEKAVAGAMKASYGAGFGIGFTKESIKLASKKSKLVSSFKDGFHAGEEAARKHAESKAAKKAASELMEEFDWDATEQEFNDEFGDCIYCDHPNCEECHFRNW